MQPFVSQNLSAQHVHPSAASAAPDVAAVHSLPYTGLLLGTEAPVVMPYSVDFCFLVLHPSLGRMQHTRSRQS